MKAPGKGDSDYFVASLNDRQMPHFVKVVNKESGHITCDDKCIRWKSFKICSHILALSEIQGNLQEFLTRFKKLNKQPRLMALATHNLPRKRGQKQQSQLPSVKVRLINKRPRLYVTQLRHLVCQNQTHPVRLRDHMLLRF